MFNEALVARGISSCIDTQVSKHPRVRQDPYVLTGLPRLGICNFPPEGHKETILYSWVGQGPERDTRAPPEVIFVFHQGGTVDSHKYQGTILVVPGVPDRYVSEEILVCPHDVVRLGPQLPTHPEHAPSYHILELRALEGKTVLQYIL